MDKEIEKTESERIKELIQFVGVSEQEARFIIAIESGEIDGDIVFV